MIWPAIPLRHRSGPPWWLLLLASCAAPAADPAQPPLVSVRTTLARGTTVRLAAEGDLGSPTLLARVRELLAQSAMLDFTAEPLPDPGPTVVLRSGEGPAGEPAWFASLLRPGEPPLPLVGARRQDDAEDLLADTLARNIRHCLGEPAADLEDAWSPSRFSYSADDAVVRATEQSLDAMQDGELLRARAFLEQALRRDAGCAQAGAYLAALLVELGEPGRGRELARGLLTLPGRLTPASAHRCARAARLADGEYEGLVRLGDEYLALRPYDPQGRMTRALGLALSDRLAEALPVLESVERRLPRTPNVHFLAAWALIAEQKPEAALARLERLRGRLPDVILARPQTFALFQLERWQQIGAVLDHLGTTAGAASGRIDFELLVMRASVALLQGERTQAADRMLAVVDRLRSSRRKDVDPARALAEIGEALVFLGRGTQLTQSLQAFDDDPYLRGELKSALTYLHSLISVTEGKERPEAALLALGNSELRGWQRAVDAAFQRQRHELPLELKARAVAAGELKTPFHRMLLARAAQDAGDLDLARRERAANRQLLETVSLRHPDRFPLAHPGHALAWLDACGKLAP